MSKGCECYLDCDGQSMHICVDCSREQLRKDVAFFLNLAEGIERNQDTMTHRDFFAAISTLYPMLDRGSMGRKR